MSSRFRLPESGLPMIILEAGVNHDGDQRKASELIELAAKSGADFIKFQTYSAEKLAAKNSPSYWNLNEEPTTSQIELFAKYDGFTLQDYKSLILRAEQTGIGFLTTCFDIDWFDALADFLPFYKIASADLTNYILIRAISEKCHSLQVLHKIDTFFSFKIPSSKKPCNKLSTISKYCKLL
jgi:N-acetylneuraminate synthase